MLLTALFVSNKSNAGVGKRAPLRRKQEYGQPVTIGEDVWVGGGALILAGVSIGSRAIIGAGSVVTRDLPERVFAAGNPCRDIRDVL